MPLLGCVDLNSLKTQSLGNQRELTEAVGIRGATLTHHLDTMAADGLVTRYRDHTNRRIQHVELTSSGERAVHRMRHAAVAFDQRLRRDFTQEEIATLRRTLERLDANLTGD